LIANCQLKIGNRQSAMSLPARLNYARDLSLQCQLAKTDAAQAELPQVSSRPTATLTARVSAHRKLRLSWCFRN